MTACTSSAWTVGAWSTLPSVGSGQGAEDVVGDVDFGCLKRVRRHVIADLYSDWKLIVSADNSSTLPHQLVTA
jgi:hypothetical protein